MPTPKRVCIVGSGRWYALFQYISACEHQLREQTSLCLEMMDGEFKEALWCNIRTATGVVLIGLCYRSPSSSATNNDHLVDMFRAAMNRSKASHVMILGILIIPILTTGMTW